MIRNNTHFFCFQIFAICAVYTTVNFDINVYVNDKTSYTFEYPFRIGQDICNGTSNKTVPISADVSSDARFFVATGVLSILYCIFISAVYATIDEIYMSKPELPLAVGVSTFNSQACNNGMFHLGFHVDNHSGHILVEWISCLVKRCKCVENCNQRIRSDEAVRWRSAYWNE